MFYPKNDRILVRPEKVEEVAKEIKTETGASVQILLTEKTKADEQKATHRGKVIAHGKGMFIHTGEFLPVCVEDGEDIIYEPYAMTEVEIKGEIFHFVRSEDVISGYDDKPIKP